MSLETAYSNAGEILRKTVKEKGPDVLQDLEAVENSLKSGNCDATATRQILLFLQTSNIVRYIPQTQTGISMIDVNNIIFRTENESGLNKDIVNRILVVVLYALSLPTALETVVIPTASGTRYNDKAIESSDKYEDKLTEIKKAILANDIEKLTPLLPELNRMAENGYAEALYQKGLCYYNACGVEENISEAIKYFDMAAHNGCISAYATLGDCYFQNEIPNYTKAFECYTALGAIANSKKRQENIKTILEEKRVNVKLLAANIVFVIAIIIFNVFLAKGSFSAYGETRVFAAIVSIVLSLAALSLSVFSFIKMRFNSIRWVTPLIFVLAMICTFFAR